MTPPLNFAAESCGDCRLWSPLQNFRENTARKTSARLRRNFSYANVKNLNKKARRNLPPMKKFFPARRKKPGKGIFFSQVLEFYTGSEQLVYSLFTPARKSEPVNRSHPGITSLRSLDAKRLRSYEFRREC